MHFFLDTNAYLSFYHFSGEDLEELKKLGVLIKQKQLALVVPEQTRNEFGRNRAAKIADALKRLREQKLGLQYPKLCRPYDEFAELRRLQDAYDQVHTKLLSQLTQDVRDEGLKADVIIRALFDLSMSVATTDQLLDRARKRVEVGNPPGKPGSLGDAINWEAVLEVVPHGEDACIVTDDADFCSALNRDEFHPFLLAGWRGAKGSTLSFHRNLSGFFRERFPHIKLASALEKELLIKELATSNSYNDTHIAVARLRRFTEFSPEEAVSIFEAADANSQVYRIASDPDVASLLESVARSLPDSVQLGRYEWLPEDDHGEPPW